MTDAQLPQTTLAIVIPVYHEQDNIQAVLADLDATDLPPTRVVIVFDDESDPTVAVVQAWQAQGSLQVELLRNTGAGPMGAYRTAIQTLQEPWTCFMTGDGSDRADTVACMAQLAAAQKLDLVAGSRFTLGGAMRGAPAVKGLLSRLANRILYLARVSLLRDSTNTFKLVRTALLREHPVESDTGFLLGLELSMRAARLRWRVAELPTVWQERAHGSSGFRTLRWVPAYLRAIPRFR